MQSCDFDFLIYFIDMIISSSIGGSFSSISDSLIKISMFPLHNIFF